MLIVIEGTDCSGKQTQTQLLYQRLIDEGKQVEQFSFPCYNTPTGKIIGGAYLGKPDIGEGWFNEGAENVDPYVASLYYAADRKYNIHPIISALKEGKIVLLNRYVTSNMAHQCGKIKEQKKRQEMYQFIETLEYDMLGLPRPDVVIFLHLPSEYVDILEEHRALQEPLDQHEKNQAYLKLAEQAYLELAGLGHWHQIECVSNGQVKSIDKIHDAVYNIITNLE